MLLFLKNPTVRYAALELALIVSGILLALGVDSWAGERAEARQERQALEALRLDLEADRARITQEIFPEIEVRERSVARIRELLEQEELGATEVGELVAAIGQAGYLAVFRPQRAAIDDLLGSGTLGILADRELRLELLRYYQRRAEWDDYSDWSRHLIWYRFRPEVGQYLDPGLMDGGVMRAAPSAAAFRTAELRDNREFRWGLLNVEGQARWQRFMLTDVLEEIDELLRQIAAATP